MATTLDALLAEIRGRSPHFTVERVASRRLAQYLTSAQRELLLRAQQRHAPWCVQVATIAFAVDPANATDRVGASSVGGLPADVTGANTAGDATLGAAPAGLLVELDFDDSQGDPVDPVTLVAPFTPSAVTAGATPTVTKTGATWTVNAFIGAHVRIVSGPGAGQRRRVVSNTATVLTLAGDWAQALGERAALAPGEAEVPDTTSLMDVVQAVAETTGTQAVVTQWPALRERRGYLVRLDASGAPYLDLGQPIVTRVDAPIPLPPLAFLLGGTVRFVGDAGTVDGAGVALTVLPYGDRFAATPTPALYVLGEAAYLCGGASAWGQVASVELRYVPIPPAFAATTDYLLLPDLAIPALVAMGAAYAAEHVAQLGVDVNVDRYAARAQSAVDVCLTSVAMQRRGRVSVMREVF